MSFSIGQILENLSLDTVFWPCVVDSFPVFFTFSVSFSLVTTVKILRLAIATIAILHWRSTSSHLSQSVTPNFTFLDLRGLEW